MAPREPLLETRCRRCDVLMEPGYALTPHASLGEWGQMSPATWTDKRPGQLGGLGGFKSPTSYQSLILEGLRCPRCGSVELFARSRRL